MKEMKLLTENKLRERNSSKKGQWLLAVIVVVLRTQQCVLVGYIILNLIYIILSPVPFLYLRLL